MIHAQSLDAICNNLAEWAINAKHLDKLDRYLRLAVKAHAQCRTTMQTLVKVKYLKQATFIRQANIAEQQQVNNATNPEAEPRAREISPNKTNELLEDQSYEPQGIRMDSRAPIRQAAMIRNWRPWETSTGPRTAAGRALSARDAWKHGGRSMKARVEMAELRRMLCEIAEVERTILERVRG